MEVFHVTYIYLIRHGETEFNSKGVYYGWTDCELNEKGIAQGKHLNIELSRIKFDAVISSTLKRAIETAVIISGFAMDSIIADERLKELNFGEWEGRHFDDIQRNNNDQWDTWTMDWKGAKPPSGESFLEMYKRIEESLNEILEKYKDKTILIVSHQGCLRTITSQLLKLNHDGYWSFVFEQGKYSLIEMDGDCCILRRINCTSL